MSNFGVPSAAPRPAPPSDEPSNVPLWAILLVLVLILTGGGFLARSLLDDGKDEVSYPASWDPRVLPYVKIAQKQRGLTFRHPVTVRFLPPEKFKKGVTTDEKELDKEDRKEIEEFTGMMRALGLIKGDIDLFDSVNDASGAGTLAYYSFEDERITIRGQKITPAMRSTMVHELTHVLQDQHFDIGAMQKKLEKSKDEDSDEEATVLDALIEGDADRVETSYRQSLSAKQRKALDSSSRGQSEEVDKTYKKIPKIVITMMTSPYTLGEAMVQAAAADGGNSAVDALFRKTPPNESALLDPLKGLTQKGDTVDVDAPKVADGEKKIDSGGFGALTWYLMLAERLPLLDALTAVSGRGGDGYLSFRRDDNVCVRAEYAGANAAATDDMLSALQRWVAAAPGSPAKVSRDGEQLTFESCDPGKTADVGKDTSDQAINLVLTRNYLGITFVRQGLPTSKARCLADKLTHTFSVARLNDPKFWADMGRDQERAARIGSSCRGA